jgi:hypothetical protein
MTTIRKNGTEIRHFQNLAPDFAQKNIYFILNLSKTTCELILPKIFFLQKYRFLKKTCFVSKIAHEFGFFKYNFLSK